MGDRANIRVKSNSEDDTGVYLYSHWSGTELPETLQVALRRGRSRWNDGQYLTRIIFCEMVKDNLMGETGYGISGYVGDGSNRVLAVNPDTQEVSFRHKAWMFSQYVELTLTELEQVWS
jgi:hypothetical protein